MNQLWWHFFGRHIEASTKKQRTSRMLSWLLNVNASAFGHATRFVKPQFVFKFLSGVQD